MQPPRDRLAAAKEIFADAIEVAPAELERLLEGRCAGDPELLGLVRALLEAHRGAARFMDSPSTAPEVAGASTAPSVHAEGPGTVIGRYKLLEQIGEGGFGVVFMAEQAEPVVRRVALKIIKAGMDTRQVIARFEAERQALAMMDHPNIAKVLDAGATETGRPYFVMELVRGDPITEYCDRNNLATPERLALFTDICHAVQHAHQKGIIHRDLKPSNVLVTLFDGKPIPKVIDFGIAKAMNQRLTDKTLFTAHRQLIGTPQYMSPEQAEMSGVDIDTRSDIYSLGVLLYELLTGTTPFDPEHLRSAALAEVQRIIREEEPQKPSTRLSQGVKGSRLQGVKGKPAELPAPAPLDTSTPGHLDTSAVAAHRRTDPAQLVRSVRGDLDWIVMKCLEKDRTRRYETANGLALDVGRHLAGEPVVAAPPSRVYRVRKYLRRHRQAIATATLLIVALATAATVFAWQAHGLRIQRDAAVDARRAEEVQKRRAQAVTDYVQSILRTSNPDAQETGSQEILVVDALMLAVKKLDSGEFRDDPDVESTLQQIMSETLLGHGRVPEALRLADGALKTISTRWATDDAAIGSAHSLVARCLALGGRFDDAVAHQQQAVERNRRRFPGDHLEVAASLNNLGDCLARTDRIDEALPLLEESLAMTRRLSRGDSENTAKALTNLAMCYDRAGRQAESLPLHIESVDVRRRVYAGDHADLAVGLYNLAEALTRAGRMNEALEHHTAALEMRRRLYSKDHGSLLISLGRVGVLLSILGHHEQSLPILEEAHGMDRRIQLLLPTHRAGVLSALGLELVATGELGNLRRAEQHLRQAVEIRQTISPEAWNLWNAESILGEAILLGTERDAALDSTQRVARLHEAEAHLLGAHEGLMARREGIDPVATKLLSPIPECRRRIVHLYTTWDFVEPDKGYDAKAAEWREKLSVSDPAPTGVP